MTLKRTLVALSLSCISLTVYAADQVIKEEMTAPSQEEAITTDQIAPLFAPPGAQAAPAAEQTQVMPSDPASPGQNMGTSQQPMMQASPQNGMSNQTQQPMQSNQPNMGAGSANDSMQQQNMAPRQPPESMQGMMPQNTMPNQQQQQPMPQQQQTMPQQQSTVPSTY